MSENQVQVSMAIILAAGDARLLCTQALESIAEYDFEKAKSLLKEAQVKITEAHRVQTDAIQDETRGTTSEYSLLFAHAQDTLMTVYSEINIAKQLVKIFGSFELRLSALENC